MKIDRKELLTVLEMVDPAVATATSIQILKHVWFDGQSVFAYSGSLGIKTVWKSELKGGLLAAPLLGIVKNTSAVDVYFEQDDVSCEIKVGRAKVTLPILPIEQHPWNFPSSAPEEFTVVELTEDFIAGLNCVRQIKVVKPNRVEHYGVVVFPQADDIALYTTDSKSMAEVFVKGSVPNHLAKTVIPNAFLTEVLKLGVGTELIFMSDAIMTVKNGLQICSNLLDRKDVLELPAFVDKTVGGLHGSVPVADGFCEALGRADVLTGSEDEFITVSLTQSELQLDGKFKHGLFQERLSLNGAKSVEGSICVGLDQLKVLAKGALDMAITNKALVLYGAGESTFLIAAHDS